MKKATVNMVYKVEKVEGEGGGGGYLIYYINE